jgi:N-acetylglucosamine-6-phosphate deacetylase
VSMWDSVRNLVLHAGIALQEALRMGSLYPARAVGRGDAIGMVAPGYEAVFVLFEEATLELREVLVMG